MIASDSASNLFSFSNVGAVQEAAPIISDFFARKTYYSRRKWFAINASFERENGLLSNLSEDISSEYCKLGVQILRLLSE